MAQEEPGQAPSTLDSIDVNFVRPGSFEGLTTGIDPVVSYATKICKTDEVAEVKWLPELDTGKRLPRRLRLVKAGSAFLMF
jgi:hypothetical protein